MASSHKKAIVRLHTSDLLPGYLSTAALSNSTTIEFLDLAGKVLELPLAQVKWVCFVRDFNSGEIDNPERLLKKVFAGRPRSAGVWLRMRLTDGDLIEGLASNDIGLIAEPGLFLTPPDIRSNTQRMFVPRSTIKDLEVVMVIAPAGKRKPHTIEPRKEQESIVQESLFS
ncbi:MAG TPA: hypothetical protein VGD64_00115 [Acidisarcina sp.]